MPLLTPRALLATAGLVVLSACGGGDGAPDDHPRVVAPLLADDGTQMPSDPAAEPADTAARTRAAAYASAEQAEMLVDALGDGVVRVAVVPWDPDAHALRGALAAVAGRPGAPVLVEGDDPVASARVADLLAAAGVAPLWLVTR